MILDVTASADSIVDYDVDPASDTVDKVFLMSVDEAYWYFRTDDERKCVPTEYARKNGANTAEEYLSDGGENDEHHENYYLDGRATCWWWL